MSETSDMMGEHLLSFVNEIEREIAKIAGPTIHIQQPSCVNRFRWLCSKEVLPALTEHFCTQSFPYKKKSDIYMLILHVTFTSILNFYSPLLFVRITHCLTRLPVH